MTKASRQSLRKDPINIVYLRVVFTIIGTHFPDEPYIGDDKYGFERLMHNVNLTIFNVNLE
jgi:hypothetical protein